MERTLTPEGRVLARMRQANSLVGPLKRLDWSAVRCSRPFPHVHKPCGHLSATRRHVLVVFRDLLKRVHRVSDTFEAEQAHFLTFRTLFREKFCKAFQTLFCYRHFFEAVPITLLGQSTLHLSGPHEQKHIQNSKKCQRE